MLSRIWQFFRTPVFEDEDKSMVTRNIYLVARVFLALSTMLSLLAVVRPPTAGAWY